MATRSALINVMHKAATAASRNMLRDFGEVENLQGSRKGPADFVSRVDTNAERIIKAELSRARPDWGFEMEESGTTAGADPDAPCWIVDPLDGTTNYLHGIPHFAISIALRDKGKITAALIFDPLRHEYFFAEAGSGAYANDRRLRVSGRRQMGESVFATGIPFIGRGSDEDHAGVGAQEVGQFVQAFNRGIFAHLGKRACALTSSEGGPQLNFSGHWADVQGLCIGVADDEVDAVDALFKHGVHGIGAATTYTDDFDRRVGRLREIEMHGRLFSDGREVEEGSGDVGLEPGLDVVHEGLAKVSFGLGRLRRVVCGFGADAIVSFDHQPHAGGVGRNGGVFRSIGDVLAWETKAAIEACHKLEQLCHMLQLGPASCQDNSANELVPKS